jgi:hypothetical protein
MRLVVLASAVALAMASLTPSAAQMPSDTRLLADADGDGMPNRWERSHGLNPRKANAAGDPDRDRLSNLDEYLLGGHPKRRDTDGDGIWDGGEVTKWGSEVDVANSVVGTAVGYQICLVDASACGHLPLPGGVVVLRDETGAEIERVLTDVEGRFALTSPPGVYTFEALAPPGFNAPGPQEVTLTELALKAHVTYGHVIHGVVGQARQSPTCGGPQRPYDDCVAPLEGATIEVQDSLGATVATVTTDDTGRYAFSLNPGDYVLIAHPPDASELPAAPAPVAFTITAEDEGPRLIDSDYDTGIR